MSKLLYCMIDEHMWLVSSNQGIRPQATWGELLPLLPLSPPCHWFLGTSGTGDHPTPPSLKDLDITSRVHKTSIIAATDRDPIDPRDCPEAATARAVEEQNHQCRSVSSDIYPKADSQQGQDDMKQVKQQPKTVLVILVRFMQCHLWTTCGLRMQMMQIGLGRFGYNPPKGKGKGQLSQTCEKCR